MNAGRSRQHSFDPTMDGAPVQVGGHATFQKLLRDHQIKNQTFSSQRPDQNPAEGAMLEVKRRWCWMQSKSSIPDQLADFGIQHTCETGILTANSSRCAKGRTLLELITGDAPDISQCLDFGFCNFVQHQSNGGVDTPRLGGWLGASHRVGKLMSCWILPDEHCCH